jgi:hypothetical protein
MKKKFAIAKQTNKTNKMGKEEEKPFQYTLIIII